MYSKYVASYVKRRNKQKEYAAGSAEVQMVLIIY